jgi:Zn-dependent protease
MAKAPQFRLAGIPVRVEPSFFIIIALFGYVSQDPTNFRFSILVSWMVIAFLSILLHELGHAVVFRLFGIRPSIAIQGFGGVTSGQGDLTPGQSLLVSLAGPLSALVLIGLPALYLWWSDAVTSSAGREVLFQVLWINIGWSVLNLMPILPLDGGNITRSLLDIVTKGRGRRPAEIVSIVTAGGLALVGLAAGQPFLAVFAGMFAVLNIGSLSRVKQVELTDELLYAQKALVEHRPIDAERAARAVLERRPSGSTLVLASEMLGWARLWQGDLEGAQAAVTRYAHAGQPSAAFRGGQALAAGRLVEGVAMEAWSMANEVTGPSKLLGAIAVAGTGQTRPLMTELLRLDGDAGVRGALTFRQLLNYAGYQRELAIVDELLAADGRAARLAPG